MALLKMPKLKRCIMIFTVYLLSLNEVMVHCEDSRECAAWTSIQTHVQQYFTADNVTCVKNALCTGLTCSGFFKGHNATASLEIKPCNDPVALELYADVPQAGVNKWNHTIITHEEKIPIPGASTPVPLVGAEMQVVLDVSFKQIGNDLSLSMSLHPENKKLSSFHFPIIEDMRFPIPSCKDAKSVTHMAADGSTTSSLLKLNEPLNSSVVPVVKDNTLTSNPPVESSLPEDATCEIGNLSATCGEHQICVQKNVASQFGFCECQLGFINNDGVCIPVVTDAPGDGAPIAEPSTAKGSKSSEHSSTSVILMAVLLPIAVLIIIIAAVIFTLRPGVIRSIRNRFQSRQYEHALIGHGGDEGEMSDPVA